MDMTQVEIAHSGKLDSNQLKWIAIICMLIDHVAWAFVETESPLGIIMHFIGRVTGPTMFFFIAEGYFHTRNIKRYALRLFIFGILSWIPFSLFETGNLLSLNLGVIWTLFLGLLALWACDKPINPFLKFAAVLGCCTLSLFGDWAIFGVLYVAAFGMASPHRGGSFKKQCIWFTLITCLMILPDALYALTLLGTSPTAEQILFLNQVGKFVLINIGCFLPLILLKFYNGARGGGKHKSFNKWTFYVFYPAHLLALWAIGLVLS